jgi:hypothetical protein
MARRLKKTRAEERRGKKEDNGNTFTVNRKSKGVE